MDKFKFLENKTSSIKHSNSSFFNHLKNTYIILKKLGEDEYLCDAGLYHSIYDTAYFHSNLNIDRTQIQNIIGSKAESLVFYFCNLKDRTNYLIHSNDIPSDIHIDLLKIEYANAIEQNHSPHNYNTHVKSIQHKLFIKLYDRSY